MTHNGFGQLLKDRQDHDSAVDAAGGHPTYEVAYAYEDGSDATKVIRPTKTTYPSGFELHTLYGSTPGSGIDHVLGRATTLATATSRGTADADVLADYAYVGAGAMASKTMPIPEIQLDYIGTPAAGDGGLANLDRFGRVQSQAWSTTGGSPTDLLKINHAYDRASNRLYAEHTVPTGGGFDELYAQDDLDRLDGYQRGDLSAAKDTFATLAFRQDWGLNQLGNWDTFDEDADGNGSWDLQQTRTHNAANEIGTIGIASGGAGSNWADPTHDAAGNMTGFAKPSTPTTNFTGIYDAWNRLVQVKDGANTVAKYTYDGLGRRVTKEVFVSGSSDHTDHFYYHGQSIVEVTVDSDPDPRERYGQIQFRSAAPGKQK